MILMSEKDVMIVYDMYSLHVGVSSKTCTIHKHTFRLSFWSFTLSLLLLAITPLGDILEFEQFTPPRPPTTHEISCENL